MMRTWCVYALAALAGLTGPIPCRAQRADRLHFFGAVEFTAGGRSDGYVVELSDVTHREPAQEVEVDFSGRYFFDRIAPGDYQLQVRDPLGRVVHTEMKHVDGSPSTYRIAVPGRSGISARLAVGAPTISVARLAHKPAKQARKLFLRAEKASAARDYTAARELYRNVVEIDPHWFEARVNLAAQCYRTGLFQQGLFQIQESLKIDPGSAIAYSNLSLILLATRDYREAERAARRSVELDPFRPEGRYVLGYVLTNLGRMEEAAEQARMVADQMPAARVLLGRIAPHLAQK